MAVPKSSCPRSSAGTDAVKEVDGEVFMKKSPAARPERRPLEGSPGFPACAALLLLASLIAPLPLNAQNAYITGLQKYPLRDTPEFSAPATTRIAAGAGVRILERKAGWVMIKAGERTGWMPETVIGAEIPATVQLGPIRERMSSLEEDLERVAGENAGLREENRALAERAGTLEGELAKIRRAANSAQSHQKFWGVALGGGLVIFGWLAGYALATVSRRQSTKHKYKI